MIIIISVKANRYIIRGNNYQISFLSPFSMGSTFKRKNLLLKENICFRDDPISDRLLYNPSLL